MKKQKVRKRSDKDTWIIPACLLVGVGIGLLTREVAAFTLIGLGTGLFIAFITRKKK